MESQKHLQHLYSEVPFHELAGQSISDLNEKELEAFILTTRAQRVAPSERRKAKTTAAKQISGKKKPAKEIITEFDHLL